MRHAEAFSRSSTRRVERAQRETPTLPMSRLHDLRHTWATLALTAGINPKVMQEGLGHSDVGTTMRIYTHSSPTIQREAAVAVAALMFKGTA
jgi:integrase